MPNPKSRNRGRRLQEARKSVLRRLFACEPMESRLLLSGSHDQALLDAITSALTAGNPTGLSAWSTTLRDSSAIGRELPLVGTNFVASYDPRAQLDALLSRLSGSYSTLTGLQTALEGSPGIADGVNVATVRDQTDDLELDVRFLKGVAQTAAVDMGHGQNLTLLGTVALNTVLDFTMTVGAYWDATTSSAVFYVGANNDSLAVSPLATGIGVNPTAALGFVDLNVSGANATLSPKFSMQLVDPGPAGGAARITLAELNGTPTASLVQTMLTAATPTSLSLNISSPLISTGPVLSYTWADINASATVTSNLTTDPAMAQLNRFQSIIAPTFSYGLHSLTDILTTGANNPVAGNPMLATLPLVNTSLSSALNLPQLFADTLTSHTDVQINGTQEVRPFNTAQQLLTLLRNLPGVGTANASVSATTGDIRYTLHLPATVIRSYPINLGIDSQLHLSVPGNASLRLDTTLDVTFGVDQATGAFFIVDPNGTIFGAHATLSASVTTPTTLGFLGVNITNGTLSLDATGTLAMHDPATDVPATPGIISGAEMSANPATSLVTPAVTGSASASLPLSTSLFSQTGTLGVSWPNVTAAGIFTLDTSTIPSYVGFNYITPSAALDGLKALPGVLTHLSDPAVFGKDLQFLGANLGPAVTLGSQMQGHISTLAPFSTIQGMVTSLQQKLGTTAVSVSVTANDVQLVLLEQQPINRLINWSTDVNVPGVNLGFRTGSTVQVNGTASANMHIGLGFAPSLTDAQRFYVLPDAQTVSTLQFSAAQTGINSSGTLGYLNVAVTGGTATVAGVTGGVLDPAKVASMTSSMVDPDSNGTITTTELTASPAAVLAPSSVQGAVQVIMPLAGLPAPGPNPRITVGWTNIASAASLAVSSQDLGNLTAAQNYNGTSASTGLQSTIGLIDQWNGLGLLNTKIPFINKTVSSIFDFTAKAKSFFQAALNAGTSTPAAFDAALNSAISNAGLDPAQVSLQPLTGNNPAGGTFHYLLNFHYSFTDPTSEKFDIGSNLLTLSASFTPLVQFNANFEFGLDSTNGFYFADRSGASSPEVQIKTGFTANFDKIGGVFGPLEYGVHNGSAGVHLDYGVDLVDPSDGGKITVGEMGANAIGVNAPVFLSTATGSLDLPMGLRLGQNGAAVTTEFTASWLASDPNAFRFGPSHSTDPADGFGPVNFEMGEFVHQIIGPVLEKVKEFNPLPQEIIDLLNYRIPLLNKTVAEEIGDVTGNDAVKLLMDIETLVTDLGNLAAGSTINLSSYFATEPNTGTSGSPTGGNSAPFQTFVDDLKTNYKVSLPVLDNLTASLANILLNRNDVVLIEWRPDPLEISKDIPGPSVEVPLFSIGIADCTANASLGASVGFFANVDLGLSTRGLTGRHIAGSGDPTGTPNLLDGFFIGDNKPGAPNGPDNQEVGIFAEVHVDLGGSVRVFGFPIATVYGRLGARMQVGLDLADVNYDPNNNTSPVSRVGPNDVGGDNRVYFDEMNWIVGTYGLPCLLELAGGLYLTGGAGFKALCTPSFLGAQICALDEYVPVTTVPLFTYDFPCSPIDQTPIAHIGVDSQNRPALIMNPDSSTQGKHVDVSIINDRNQQPSLVRVNKYDASGHVERQDFPLATITSAGVVSLIVEGTAGPDVITVAPEVSSVLNIQYIVVDAGAGDDRVDFGQIDETKSHLLGTTVYGGAGNDLIIGTFRADDLEGGADNDSILGYKGNDTILGGDGVDQISGGIGSVWIDGGAGDDQIDAKDGQNTIYGSDGNDLITSGVGTTLVFGGNDNDSIYAAGGNNTVNGDAGNDMIITEGNGHNVITGGAGFDGIYTGAGIDEIDGGTEDDYISAADGDNVIFGQSGFDTILAGAGKDYVSGGGDGDLINAGDGDNKVYGDAGDDSITTGLGQDIIFAGDGNDLVHAGAGDDFIDGGLGANTIGGDAGIDELAQVVDANQVLTNATLSNPAGVATFADIERVGLTGGPGNNLFDVSGWSGAPVQVDGSGGYDTLVSTNEMDCTLSDGSLLRADGTRFSLLNTEELDLFAGALDSRFDVTHYSGNAQFFGGSALTTLVATGLTGATLTDTSFSRPGYPTITLSGVNRASLTGTDGNDVLDASGFSGNVTLLGLAGDDHLTGGSGDDYIDGGTGRDVLVGNAGSDELVATFGTAGANLDGGPGDDLLIGSDLADTFTAGPGRDKVYGKAGADLISGGDDADSIWGGDGNDTLSGDGGPDVLYGAGGGDLLWGQNATDTGEDNAGDILYGDYGTDGNEPGGGADALHGQGGPDLLFGEGNDDVLDGGSGPGDRIDPGVNTPNSLFPAPDPTPAVTPRSDIVTTAIFPTEATFGQRWSEFGSSASGLGVSNSVGVATEPAIVTSATGQYTAWADNRSGNYEIYVALHTASGYAELGSSAHAGGISATPGSSRRPAITLDALGNPIVAWTEVVGGTSNILAARWSGTAWVALGASLAAAGTSGTGKADNARIVNTSAGPIVAWLDSSGGVANIFARQFDSGSSSWVPAGTGAASGTGVSGSAASISTFAMATDGTHASVAWTQPGAVNHVYLREYSGTLWAQINGSATGGGVDGASSSAGNPTVAYFGGHIYVAWEQSGPKGTNIAAARNGTLSWDRLAIDTPASAGFAVTRGAAGRPQLAAGGSLQLVWTEDRQPSDSGRSMALYANRFDGTAFRQELPGDAAFNGIHHTSTQVTSMALSVDSSGHPFVAWGDLSSGSPQIYFRGNPFDVNHVYYVNDASQYQDVFTTAPGSIGNTGQTPASPRDSVQSLLSTFNLQPGDVILVDTGSYGGFTIPSSVTGVLVTGSTGRTAVFSAPVLMDGAQNSTLHDLAFASLTLNNAANLTVQDNVITNLAISGGSINGVVGNLVQNGGVAVGGSAAGVVIEHNRFIDPTAAIVLNGAVNVLVRDNRMTGVGTGVSLAGASSGEISGNYIDVSTGMGLAAAFTGAITGNDIQGSSTGVEYQFNTPLYGNRIHGGNVGVRAVSSPTLNLGGTGPAIPNDIFGNVVGVQLAATMQNQHVFGNGTGVQGSGTLGPASLDQANLIELNGIGADFTGTIQFNRFSRNTTAINAEDSNLIANNLFYGDMKGVAVSGHTGVQVVNNTFYATQGDNIHIDGGSSNVTVRNNILWAQNGGYDLYIATDSQAGFVSDHNNLYASNGGLVVWWEKPFADLYDWQIEADLDLHSIGYISPSPFLDDPQFLHIGTANFQVAFTSTSINSADPATAFSAEPNPNGNRADLGAYGGTSLTQLSPPAYVRLDYPIMYLDWEADRAELIKWHVYNVSGSVKLEVTDPNGSHVADIATVNAATGQFLWSPQDSAIVPDPVNRYRIRIASIEDPTAFQVSREVFSVPPASNHYYINDSSTTGDAYTTVVGNNRNTGRFANAPKADVLPILRSYLLTGNDTVFVDTGNYIDVRDLIIYFNTTQNPNPGSGLGDDQGFVIAGPTDPSKVAYLDRANPYYGSTHVELNNASFMTLSHLTLVGAVNGIRVHSTSSNFKTDTIVVANDANDGINLDSGAVASEIRGATVYNHGGYGIYVAGQINRVVDSTVYNSGKEGIYFAAAGNVVVQHNVAHHNDSGIYINGANGASIGAADPALGLGNQVYSNVRDGIFANGTNMIVGGNTAFGQTAIGQAGLRVFGSAQIASNIVYGNTVGLASFGTQSSILNNLAYGNPDAGIDAGGAASVSGNVVYQNTVGIRQTFGGAGVFANNLLYLNNTAGILVFEAPNLAPNNLRLWNNTVYQTTGDGILIENGSRAIEVRNNILFADGSARGINVTPDSQVGFVSDYNLLYTRNGGVVGFWQGAARPTLVDWQNATFTDANSLSQDPLFVSIAGNDYHEQSQYGSNHGGTLAPVLSSTTGLPVPNPGASAIDALQSPAIDRGDASFPFANEPAPNGNFINLGAYGNTVQASKSPAHYVLVTKPDGGEIWPEGQIFPITWRSDAFTGTVRIELFEGAGTTPVALIADGAPNNGQYPWTVPASLTPASDYIIKVTRLDGSNLSDTSNAPFRITAEQHLYYVNDSTFSGGDYTTAVGDDGNSGLDPAHPKASISGILAAYHLTSADTILVDNGTYNLTANIAITSDDAGVTIMGYTGPNAGSTILNRGNTNSGNYVFELQSVNGVTLDHLTITGANAGVFASDTSNSDNITIRNSAIINNFTYGVNIGRAADFVAITGSIFTGTVDNSGPQGINILVDGNDTLISGNTIHSGRTFVGSGGWGILPGGLRNVISNNEIYNTNAPIQYQPVNFGMAFADAALITGNLIHDNGTGIYAQSYARVIGNTAYNHTQNTGFSASTGISVGANCEVTQNTVYSNINGISATGMSSVSGNRVYNNTGTGITLDSAAMAQGNQVYSNAIGITSGGGTVLNNTVYANSTYGLLVRGASFGTPHVLNNTVDQPTGSAMRVENSTATLDIRDNIIRFGSGAAFDVNSDGQQGFASDWNLLWTTGAGVVAKWGGTQFATVTAFSSTLGFDAHSLWADPMFLNPAGPDGVLGGNSGADDNFHLQGNSPAVDAGDPNSYYLAEPSPNGGRVNIGADGNTSQANISSTPLVQVVTPNAGEKFEAGKVYNVQWRSSGLHSSVPVALINAGSPTSVDNWLYDSYGLAIETGQLAFNNAFAVVDTSGVTNPPPLDVYRSWASGASNNARIAYQLPVPDGTYTLRLHFADFAGITPGQRVFDIRVQGATVLSGFDIAATAGGGGKAVAESFTVTATAGQGIRVDLVGNPLGSGPIINALELGAANPSATTTATFGLDVSPDNGATWVPIASGLTDDRFGRGSYPWTAGPATSGVTALVRVTATAGATVLQDRSDHPFRIAPAGHNYYINDASMAGDVFTSAVGNDLNSGKTPDSPMATLSALLTAYSPGAGDTVFVDHGTYNLLQNVLLTAALSGVIIKGPADASAVFDRGDTGSGKRAFEIVGANNVTLDHLTIMGGEFGVHAPQSFTGNNSNGLMLSNNVVTGNYLAGIQLEFSNVNSVIVGNTIYGDPTNAVFQHRQETGLSVAGASSSIIGNNVYSSKFGIVLGGSTGGVVSNNTVHDNTQYGIQSSGSATVSNNTVYAQSSTNAAGIYLIGGTVTGNTVFNNYDGIYGSQTGGEAVTSNRIFHNSHDGIVSGGAMTAQANIIYSNGTGIEVTSYQTQLFGNLVYGNAQTGIYLHDTGRNFGAQVISNTVYQPAGDAVRLLNAPGVSIRNNILEADNGYGLFVPDDSESGLVSDYNLFYAAGTGRLGNWQGVDFGDLTSWFYALGQDGHSRIANPQFINPAGVDGILGYDGNTLADHGQDDVFHTQASSPAVDAGDPSSLFFQEPSPNGSRINLGYDGNTPQAATSRSQFVQVLSPNGREKFSAGQLVPIQWRSYGLTNTSPTLLLNAGGPATGIWSADSLRTGGSALQTFGTVDTSGISNPAPADAYNTYAQGDTGPGGMLAYTLAVPDGTYTIALDFFEPVGSGAGQRVFDIKLQGQTVLGGFDIFAAANASLKATRQTFTVSAVGGSGIQLQLVNQTFSPAMLAAMSIVSANPAGTASPSFNIDLSTDGGTTWAPLGFSAPVDPMGNGSFDWSAGPVSSNDLIRVTATAGTKPQDLSDGPFLVAPFGHDYYVNDNSTTGDFFTTAPGSDANSGKTPGAPMATLAALLSAYHPRAGDTVHVDAGTYLSLRNIVFDSSFDGVKIEGPANNSAVLNRGSQISPMAVFELQKSTGVIWDHLSITGSYYGIYGNPNFLNGAETITNNSFHDNTRAGIYIDGTIGTVNTSATISGNSIVGAGNLTSQFGVLINSSNVAMANNSIHGFNTGVQFTGGFATSSSLTGNEVYGNFTGISAVQSLGSVINFPVTISGNSIHDNDNVGLNVSGGITASDNVVYNNDIGNNGTGITGGGSAQIIRNTVYSNYNGISSSSLVAENRVFHNVAAGIIANGFGAPILRNRVYSNAIGILSQGFYTGQIAYNLVYANANRGISIPGGNSAQIVNNTLYTPVGDAIRIEGGSQRMQVRNNIIQILAGYGLYVDPNSTFQFSSDRNLFFKSSDPNAHIGSWQGVNIDDLGTWQTATAGDANSRFGDPLFVDINGADNVFGFVTNPTNIDGGADDNFQLVGGSPAIDHADSIAGPLTDIVGDPRLDDPGTPNTGTPDYTVAVLPSSSFTATGTFSGGFFTLPFAFPFYDQTVTSVSALSSGYILMPGNTTGTDPFANTPVISPMGGFNGSISANVFVDTTVAGQVMIRWQGFNTANNNSPVNFAAVLFSDGNIRFDYGSGNAGLSSDVRIGISRGDGVHYLVAPYDGQSSLPDANSVQFTLAPGFAELGAYEFGGSSADVTPPVVVSTVPAEIHTGGAVNSPLSSFQVNFSESMSIVDANAPANYELRWAGPNGTFGDTDDVLYPLVPSYALNSTTVTLDNPGAPVPSGLYRFIIFSDPTRSVHDNSGIALDGNYDGIAQGSYIRVFTVGAANTPPTINLGPFPAIDEGGTFNGTGSFTDPDVTDVWTATVNYGDGSGTQALPLNPDKTFSLSHLYGDNGVFTISVTVDDGSGGVTTQTASLTVNSVAPTATFSNGGPITEGNAGLVSFANPFDPSPADTAAGFTYGYDFNNDGTFEISNSTGTSAVVPAPYLSGAVRPLVVHGRITDKDGAHTDYTTSITVHNLAPQASIGGDVTVNVGQPVSRDCSFTDPGTGETYTLTVDYGDGGGVQPLAFNPDRTFTLSHTWNTAGMFTVTVVIDDNNPGGLTQTSFTVHAVTISAQGLDVTATQGQASGLLITAQFFPTDPSLMAGDFSATIDWGDGTTSPGSISNAPTGFDVGASNKIYSTAGKFTVSTTITQLPSGPTVMVQSTATVSGGVAVTPVNVNATEGTPLHNVLVATIQTDATGASAIIDWGDGSSSSGVVQPNLLGGFDVFGDHTYALHGSYTTTITVTDTNGATGSEQGTARVADVAPTVSILNAPTNVTVGTPIHLTSQVADAGVGDTYTFAWTITRNGSPFASGSNPDITFTPDAAGTYAVSLMVTDSGNASGSDSKTITAVQASIGSVAAVWGTVRNVQLQTAADGLRLLPRGRTKTIPWANLNRIQITLDRPAALSAADVSVKGISVADYGPVRITGMGATWMITLARPIAAADRVTLTIGSASIAAFTRRLDVLPGDVYEDGLVNSVDIVLIRNMIVGLTSPTIFGDLDGNGTVDLDDYNLARRYIGTHLP